MNILSQCFSVQIIVGSKYGIRSYKQKIWRNFNLVYTAIILNHRIYQSLFLDKILDRLFFYKIEEQLALQAVSKYLKQLSQILAWIWLDLEAPSRTEESAWYGQIGEVLWLLLFNYFQDCSSLVWLPLTIFWHKISKYAWRSCQSGTSDCRNLVRDL